jgi:hypothetical protein
MAERTRERRDLLTTVRRSVWRAAFLADEVLAISIGYRRCERERGL